MTRRQEIFEHCRSIVEEELPCSIQEMTEYLANLSTEELMDLSDDIAEAVKNQPQGGTK